MKSILVSSCFISAALAAPFVARTGSTTIQMKTGDSDVSVQVTVPLDTVFSTAGNRQAQVGAGAFVLDTGITCHAFSDNAGLKPLGDDFNDTMQGIFTNEEGAGEVGTEDKGVPIGAFFCSESQAAVDAQVAKGSSLPPPPSPTPSTIPSATPTSIIPTTYPPTSCPADASSSSATVRIQNVFDNGETATQLHIPINALFLTANTLLSKKSNTLSIISATGVDVNTVGCQAFKDTHGRRPVGSPFGVQEVAFLDSFGPGVPLKAIKCVSQ